jgi:hypothetical protein
VGVRAADCGHDCDVAAGILRAEADGSRVPAVNQSLYEILHNQPNADQTAVVFWQCVAASLLLWGNAFIEITRDVLPDGVIGAQLPDAVTRDVSAHGSGGELSNFYVDNADGAQRVIDETRMMHIPAFTTDGKWGLSPVAYGANVLGSTRRDRSHGVETFGNSLRSPGVISMDMVFKKDQREEVRKHVREVSESGGVMVLERGAKFEKLSTGPGFRRAFGDARVERRGNLPLVWRGPVDGGPRREGFELGHWARAENALAHRVHAAQWCVSIEQAIRKNLIPVVERQRISLNSGLRAAARR